MACDHLKEIVALRDKIDDLEAELAGLRETFDRKVEGVYKAFNVTLYHARALTAMARGGIITREQLLRHCLREGTDDPRNVEYQIKRIRMRNTGLTIKSIYGAGYVLEGESLAAVRAAMKGTTPCDPPHATSSSIAAPPAPFRTSGRRTSASGTRPRGGATSAIIW